MVVVFGNLSMVSSQSTAIDFDVNDCNGIPHHLFAELNAGKVVVMSMVHPCASCIGPSKTALNTVKSFATSHPGRVLFYLTDDVGNTSCTSLTSWASTNAITGVPIFSNIAISQLDYGSAAMPKVVVLGGSDHHIYEVQDNGVNAVALAAAINTALLATGLNEKQLDRRIAAYPIPADNKIVLDISKLSNQKYTVEIYNLLGVKVKSMQISKSGYPSAMETQMDIENLQNGIYYLTISASDYTEVLKFTVKH